jgi:hypothetical protein
MVKVDFVIGRTFHLAQVNSTPSRVDLELIQDFPQPAAIA